MKYSIVIILKSGEKRYIGKKRNGSFKLVKRQSRLILDEEWVANVVSDWFYQNYWDRDLYETRDLEVTFK
jgi:hypothetical protein